MMKYLPELSNAWSGSVFGFPHSVDDLFKHFWGLSRAENEAWKPMVDIVETATSYRVTMELPGVKPEDVDLTLVDNTLNIRGESKAEADSEGETWRLRERRSACFERSFTFPNPVSSQQIEAEARDGLLLVTVGKADEPKPRKIEIRTK